MLITCYPVGPRIVKPFVKNLHGRIKKAEIIWITCQGNLAVGTFRRTGKTTGEVTDISVCVIKPRRNRTRIRNSVPVISNSATAISDSSKEVLDLAAKKRNMVCDV